ncbi:MAG: GNAT family N-acetyltransferase [Actinomycetota bacterium]
MIHEVRAIAGSDLEDVARVHIAAFPSSDLTRAGRAVVRLYYQTQWERPTGERLFSGLWVEGRLAAFICAGFLGDALPLFVRRHRMFLIRHLVTRPWLLIRLTTFARARLAVGADASGSSEGTASPPAYRVLSVGTHPAFRDRGFAGELLTAAEEAARAAGQREIGLTVEPTNEAAVSLYLGRGWQRADDQPTWSGAMRKVLG